MLHATPQRTLMPPASPLVPSAQLLTWPRLLPVTRWLPAGCSAAEKASVLSVSRHASAATSHSLMTPSTERDMSRPGRCAALLSSMMSVA